MIFFLTCIMDTNQRSNSPTTQKKSVKDDCTKKGGGRVVVMVSVDELKLNIHQITSTDYNTE